MAVSPSLVLGQRFHDRYLLETCLEPGGTRATYLARDGDRFDEPCVLRAFLGPGGDPLQEAAKILYRLHHPQIAAFRAFFRLDGDSGGYLVQEFVEGVSYQTLLDQGQVFREGEVRRFFQQLLPVLAYCHTQSLIYGSERLGGVIRRSPDGVAVLTDGTALQAVGKFWGVGGNPYGRDLQTLARWGTMLLAPGTALPSNYDMSQWEGILNRLSLSEGLRALLLAMVGAPKGGRWSSATAVLDALQALPPPPSVPLDSSTVPPAKIAEAAIVPPESSAPVAPPAKTWTLKLLWLLGAMAIAGIIGWGVGKLWLHLRVQALSNPDSQTPASPRTELEKRNALRSRRLNLEVSPQTFQTLANDWVALTLNQTPNPDPQASPLGTEKEQLQAQDQLLSALEALSPQARQYVETVPLGDRRRWIPRVNQLRLSSRSFNDLVQARLTPLMPNVSPEALAGRPLDRLWNGLAFDTLTSLEDGSRYQRLTLTPDNSLNLAGELQPGQGNAYAINIPQGETFNVKLTAPAGVHLSLYSPSGQTEMLQNSATHEWSAPLTETGYYEVVITPTKSEPATYQLTLQVQ